MIPQVLVTASLLGVQAADSQYQSYMSSYGGDSSSSSQSQSGNYQKYMKEYAGGQGGDYQKYMKKYAGGQGGDYQKYMKKYAGGQGGDYQQYMKKYGGGQGGNYQGGSNSVDTLNLAEDATGSSGSQGNYKQYLNKYAGSYEKYFDKYTKQNGGGQGSSYPSAKTSDSLETLNLAEDATGSGGSQGNYKQYLNKYAGSYEKYFDKYTNNNGGGQGGNYQGGASATSSDSLSALNLDAKDTSATDSQGNYQQYMQKYAGGQGGQGGNYQQYMDKYASSYEHYFDKYTHGGQGGDYQQYMEKYAGGQGGNYQQYMKKYAGGQGGDYQQYMQKYTGGSQGANGATELMEKSPTTESDSLDTLNLAATSTDASSAGSKGNYQQYMDKYAGSYEQYMKKYAGDYQKYQDYQKYKDCGKGSDSKIRSAKDAQNQQELQEWMQGALQKAKCFVPDDYTSYVTKDIDEQYKRRLKELNSAADDTEVNQVMATKDTESSASPFMTKDAVDLIETPVTAEKTQKASKTFLAKSSTAAAETKIEELAKEAKHKAEIAEANLSLFANQAKSDPVTVVGAPALGAALAFFVFFAFRFRRNVQAPVEQLG